MSYLAKVKLDILACLPKHFGLAVGDFRENWRMENANFGELSLPMFRYLKQGGNPEIFQKLTAETVWPVLVDRAEFKDGFLNFHLNFRILAREIFATTKKHKKEKTKEQIMIEFVAPNTNKPLHLGHLRNAFLGEALANILKETAGQVIRTTLYNDRGVSLSKAMVAYEQWGKEIKRQKKGDHWVGDLYVSFEQRAKENPALARAVQKYLEQWESGDRRVVALWKKLRDAALRGQKETLRAFGIYFDKEYFESRLWKSGVKLVEDGLRQGLFTHDEQQNVIADLEREGLGKKVVLRANGTAVYVTTDLYLAFLRRKEFPKAKFLYVVGSEQDFAFKQLFAILVKMKLNKNNFEHVSYGIVTLPEGRMKSREGTVVDADDILDELIRLANEEVRKRFPTLRSKEVMRRSSTIAMAAIKYYFLHVSPKSSLQFNPEESISFTGNTGPYLLYTYARAKSILRKKKSPKQTDSALLKQRAERQLLFLLARYEEVLAEAKSERNPAMLAQYLYDLASVFNDFYHQHPVLTGEPSLQGARLKLVALVSEVLARGLNILGIKVLEKM